jgi:hypothetical protein
MFEACDEAQQIILGDAPERAHRDNLRLAFRERARLVDHERVDLFEPLQGLGVLDQNAGLSPAPDADHDRHGRCQPERAGTGDDQHRDGRHEAVGKTWLRPPGGPDGESRDRNRDGSGANGRIWPAMMSAELPEGWAWAS